MRVAPCKFDISSTGAPWGASQTQGTTAKHAKVRHIPLLVVDLRSVHLRLDWRLAGVDCPIDRSPRNLASKRPTSVRLTLGNTLLAAHRILVQPDIATPRVNVVSSFVATRSRMAEFMCLDSSASFIVRGRQFLWVCAEVSPAFRI